MPLDADAQAAVDLQIEAFPDGLHALPIEQTRLMMLEGAKIAPPGPEMARVEDRNIPSGEHQIPVRIYWPSEKKDLPALIWLHGGAFALGNLETTDATSRHLAEASGTVVVSVDYRLAPEHKYPAGLEDAYTALQWVVENSQQLGINPKSVAIGGDSAGGTLADLPGRLAKRRVAKRSGRRR